MAASYNVQSPCECGEAGVPDLSEYYSLLFTVRVEDTIPVSWYRSKRTGFTFVLADVEGPLVNGYIIVPTEAHDDDGLPHTLEHLCFMGSESYPFKGVLDLLANRCLASGTNAWTDVDHTCYTLTTAGCDGFLHLLPIYLDHVLYPTLQDSAFLTEVHHINGDGEDAGVVYSEMQGRENTGESLTNLAMLRAIYPGKCGYKSETGGILKNLRESTSNARVRAFHRQFYRPENLSVLISGKVHINKVFHSLQKIEEKMIKKGAGGNYHRPWQSPVPSFSTSFSETVHYPSDFTDSGLVVVAWRGPKAKDYVGMDALDILLIYLTDSAVSPLQREFVEQNDPWCSKVAYNVIENSEGCFSLVFENVPTEKLTSVRVRLFDVLSRLTSKQLSFDMKRLQTLLHRKELNIHSSLERDPHEVICHHVIGHFLYGDNEQEFNTRVHQSNLIRKLMNAELDFWTSLLELYMLKAPSVTIIGEPSNTLMQEMGDHEKERIRIQRKILGPDGLQKKTETLRKAIEQNEKPPSDQTLSEINVPSTACISFHSIRRWCNYPCDPPPSRSQDPPPVLISEIPIRFQLDDIKSKFFEMRVLLDTSRIPSSLRYYLPLWTELILESAMVIDNSIVSHEEVIRGLAEDTIALFCGLGVSGDVSRFSCGSYAQMAQLYTQVEPTKYTAGVTWLYRLLYETIFSEERIRIIATKMINDVAKRVRKGNKLVYMVSRELCFTKESNHCANNMLRQNHFLTTVLKLLDADSKKVLSAMEKLRQHLVDPLNLTIHVSCATRSIQPTDFIAPWKTFNKKALIASNLMVQQCHSLLQEMALSQHNSAILGAAAIESSYMVVATPFFHDHLHTDLPTVMVLLQYLTQTEGPLWRQVRGLGLAYGYTMTAKPNEGLLFLTIYKSTQVVQAFNEIRKVVMAHINGATAYDQTLMESARSSLVFEIIEKEKSLSDVAQQSLLNYLRGVGRNYNKLLLQYIARVTIADLNRVGPIYISNLFVPSKSWYSVCCNAAKLEELIKGFKDAGVPMTPLKMEDSFFTMF